MDKIIGFIIGDKGKKDIDIEYNKIYKNKESIDDNNKQDENTLKEKQRQIIIELMHDLKTPIISTIGFLQLLESNNQEIRKNIEYENLNKNIKTGSSDSEDDENKQRQSSVNSDDLISTPTIDILNENQDFISEALENLETLLKKISQMASESKKCHMYQDSLKRISLKLIVEGVIKILKPLAIQNNIDIAINVPIEHYVLFERQKEFEKIIIHLVENAIKYNHYGGFIEITSEIVLNQNSHQKELVIDVIDTGIGFSKEQLRKINSQYIDNQFNPEIEIKDKCSFGVGLTIVKKIVNNIDGKIIINSLKNRGTTIKLFFPYAE